MGLHLDEIWSKAFRVVNVEPNISCDSLILAASWNSGLHMMRHLALRCHLVLMHLAADV